MGASQREPVLREPEEAISGSLGNSPPSVHSRKDSPAGSAPRSRWARGKGLLDPGCTLRVDTWLPAALSFPHGTLTLRPLPSEHQAGIPPRGHAHVQGSSGRSCEKRDSCKGSALVLQNPSGTTAAGEPGCQSHRRPPVIPSSRPAGPWGGILTAAHCVGKPGLTPHRVQSVWDSAGPQFP
uniref:Uncharacterized protein n=1 Tax=Myotis myotis TaxID=51298 RepID=A0A7J7S2P3_MYOMY|nr:hypothetical protein mMyoMyo1_010060 [Myotis myotis]